LKPCMDLATNLDMVSKEVRWLCALSQNLLWDRPGMEQKIYFWKHSYYTFNVPWLIHALWYLINSGTILLSISMFLSSSSWLIESTRSESSVMNVTVFLRVVSILPITIWWPYFSSACRAFGTRSFSSVSS
jgi:hypothetical protein